MAERRVVEVANAPKHYNPIPTCVTLGNLILPSVIGAYDPAAAATAGAGGADREIVQ